MIEYVTDGDGNKDQLDISEPTISLSSNAAATICWYCKKTLKLKQDRHIIFVDPQPQIRVQFIHDKCLILALNDHMEWWHDV